MNDTGARGKLSAIGKALERMGEIMEEPSVVAMLGEAYSSNDIDRLGRATESLSLIDPEPSTHVAEVMNRKHLDEVFKSMETAHYLLNRVGFEEVRGRAFVDRDQRVVDDGYDAALQFTGHSRA